MTFTHNQVVIICIAYDINLWPYAKGPHFTLENSYLELLNWLKNADPDEYKYSGYGTGFDARGSFSLSNGSGFGKYVIVLVLV